MKKFTLISAIILSTNFVYAQWVQLEQFTDNSLKSVFFTDANTGYAAGDNGTIAKTNDGGMNWEVQTVGEDMNVYSLHFPNKSTGYALGRYGNMMYDTCAFLKTVDEGMNWSINVIDSSFYLTGINFTSVDTGYICGNHFSGGVNNGLILKTTNGGNDWTISVDEFGYYRAIHFPSSDTGYVMGHSVAATQPFYIMLKTVDAGQTWVHSTGTPYLQEKSLYFINNDIGFAVGNSKNILKTTDGGTNWISQEIDTSWTTKLASVFFTDSNTGYIAGWKVTSDEGCIFQTIDGGENWVYEYIGDNPLYSIHFPTVDTGYMVGEMGVIFKTTNGGNQSGVNTKTKDNENFSLYPNPFSSTSLIKYSLSHTTSVTIQIHNLNGQIVLMLIDEKKQRGNQQVLFDASQLESGIYICTLKTNKGIQTRKIVKL